MRSYQDAQAGEGIGIAATRIEERILAVTESQVYAASQFDSNESVENGERFPPYCHRVWTNFLHPLATYPKVSTDYTIFYCYCVLWPYAG